MFKKAVEFLRENSSKKTIMIFDRDGDGTGAAAILTKTLEKEFDNIPTVMLSEHGLDFISEKMFKKMKNEKYDFIITLDFAIDSKPKYILKLSKKSKILVIDHHQVHRNLNNIKNIMHINPALWNSKVPPHKYCTSKIIYDICNELIDINDLDWLAGIGIVNDQSEKQWKHFLNKIYKKYKISLPKLRLINNIITSGFRHHANRDLMICYRACIEASSPLDILRSNTPDIKKLKKFYDEIEREIVSTMKNWKKIAEIYNNKKLIILKLNTKFSLSSPISTKISFKKPHYTVLAAKKENNKMIYMSLRRQDGKIDCGKFATKLIKGLENASGGGHIPAAGIHIMSKDWKIFRKRLMESF